MAASRIGPLRTQDTDSDVYWKGDVLVVRFCGYVTGANTRRITEAARRALSERAPRTFVFDCSTAHSYSTDVREPGVELLQSLRQAGAEHGYAVSVSSSVRMIGTAIAFVAGIKVKFVETLPEALAELSE